ncbi:TPA: potassium-transporting ATPase subunit KdpC [Kluyvera ascorbata]|uniref:potassium-transporting ATPase subunit KdpC n=1 Tax=Kluyvera TaxID=579 RepID=UPI001CC218BF|nr:potassium-transporting ATPase subunit KdpC [Kluyvera sp. CRP]UAK18157.1 potassium-transporting ATPase subunit KdpC [Kluyvera sp. CRP]HCR3983607.1 potassium-transporting ATPase subunit KdpC [Kluyvera ascorbata]HDT6544081.1 potassium-transporting ATPase subunit KdpC [Kluyvera ascorbata]
MSALRPAIVIFLFLAVITGGVYPLLTTALGQWLFHTQANGSLIFENHEIRGSQLIGQNFSDPGYFQGRPSATADAPDNPMASGGSNLAGSNPALDKLFTDRIAALRAANPDASRTVPVELVTASASGLDANLSPAAALWQVPRIAKARGLSPQWLTQQVQAATHTPLLGFLGQPVVNIIELNMALDAHKDN